MSGYLKAYTVETGRLLDQTIVSAVYDSIVVGSMQDG